MIKNLPASVGDMGSIPGSGRSPEEENDNPHSSILAWRIPWTEELGGLQFVGSQMSQKFIRDYTTATTCPLMRVSRDLVIISFLTHSGRCLYK